MSRVRRFVCAVSSALLIAAPANAFAQWPQFRGPNGSGVDTGAGYPVAFSPTKNLLWNTAIPDGQSSPVLAGGRLYLTAKQGEQLLTISLDAATGRELWRREIKYRADREGLPRQ